MAGETDTHHADTHEAGKSHDASGQAGHAGDLHTGTEAHGGAHHDVGFPPFDVTMFAPQLIWLALSFTVLYLLMSRIALPRIADIIEERGDRIKRDLGTAERLKSETEKALSAYEQALADARGNANEIAKQTRDKLGSEVDAERARVDAEINTKVADAEARILQTRRSALDSVNEIAGDVAGTLVEKLIGTSATADEVKAAVDQIRSNS